MAKKSIHPAEAHVLNVALSQVSSEHIQTDEWESEGAHMQKSDNRPVWSYVNKRDGVCFLATVGGNGIQPYSLGRWVQGFGCVQILENWPVV